MKIAICHTQLSSVGGSERYIWFLLNRLLGDGHEIHYYCARQRDPLEHPRLHLHHVARARGVRSLKVMSFAHNSARQLSGDGPFDVIHGFSKTWFQDVYTDGSGLQSVYRDYLARDVGPCRRLMRRHAPYQHAVDLCERRRFKRGNFVKILTMSRFVKEQIQEAYGLDDSEVEVLYNGIDCGQFTPQGRAEERGCVRREISIPPEAFVVLFIGSDYARKNLALMLRALALLGGTPDTHLMICGRDNHEAAFRRRAEERNLGSRCHFLGMQKDVKRFLSAADLLVLPSYYDVFGMVALEAMACGVPPIVSSAAGASEIISTGEDGAVLTELEDPAQLAGHIRSFQDREHLANASARARQTALEYDWANHMRRLYAVYEHVAATKHAGAPGR